MALAPYRSVLLVDGSNVLHAVLHTGLADLKSEAGEFGGAFGFLRSLRFILSRQPVDRCVAFWDGSLSSRRREILPEYKKRPDEVDEVLAEHRTQYQVARNVLVRLLPMLGVLTVYERDHEADDLLYCARNLGRDLGWKRFVVCSEDKDFYQMIDRDTAVYRPIRKVHVDRHNFMEVTSGVPHLKYMLYRAICGDPSDCISGIPLVGDKTAQTLCEAMSRDVFESHTNIDWARFVAECEVQPGKKIQRVVESLEVVQRNLEMMALDREELPFEVVERTLDTLTTPRQNRLDEAYEVLETMEFYSMTEQYAEWSIPFLRVSVG